MPANQAVAHMAERFAIAFFPETAQVVARQAMAVAAARIPCYMIALLRTTRRRMAAERIMGRSTGARLLETTPRTAAARTRECIMTDDTAETLPHREAVQMKLA